MKHLSLLFLLFLSFALNADAQEVTGTVVNGQRQAIPFTTVALFHQADSAFAGGSVTDENGRFSIAATPGQQFILQVSCVGYKPLFRHCGTGELGEITLEEDTRQLDELTVMGKRIMQRPDGYTVNLQASDIVKGKQTTEMLAFLPGVTYEDGVFKINGITVNEIYVNGQKLTDIKELSTLPADMVEKVNVEYLSGLNRHASNMGGTLNLTLRKPAQGGYYGTAGGGLDWQAAQGPDNEYLYGVINYRYKDLSIYDNLSVMFNQGFENSEQYQWNEAGDLLKEIRDHTSFTGWNVRNRLSLSRQLQGGKTVAGSYYMATNRQRIHSNAYSGDILSDILRRQRYTDQEVFVKYATPLNGHGMNLDMTADYFNRHQDNRNEYESAASATASREEAVTDLVRISADVTMPRSENLNWKYGASVRYIAYGYTPLETVTDSRFHTVAETTRATGVSPHVYAQANGNWGKLQYTAGASWQLNKLRYKVLESGEKSSYTQWGLNPMLQLMMPLDKKGNNSLTLKYKRTLADIPYDAISSSVRWSDAYHYSTGNSELKSPSDDMVMLGASMLRSKLSLTLIYYRDKNDIFWETLASDVAEGVYYTRPVNLPAQNMYTAVLQLNLNPLKCWYMKLNARLSIRPEDVTLSGVYYGDTHYRQYYSTFNSFTFPHGWGGMINFIFEPTFTTYNRVYHRVYNLGGNLYKDLCKDRLRISTSFNIIGDRRCLDTVTDGVTLRYNYTTPIPNIELSLSWNFAGGKKVSVNRVSGTQSYQEIQDFR